MMKRETDEIFAKRLQQAIDNDELPEYMGTPQRDVVLSLQRWGDSLAEHYFRAGYMCAMKDMEAANAKDKGTAGGRPATGE